MTNALRALDIDLHLHSQTNARAHEERGPLALVRGEGVHVVDDSGRRYIEGMAGLWCASLGFDEARLADAAARQMRTLATYHTFNHRTNDACVALAEAISAISPIRGGRIFFANSGSEANDTMVKLAWYYNAARGRPEKRKIISRTGAFHGSTVMGAALSGLPHMHRAFNLPDQGVVFTACPNHARHAGPGESQEDYATRLSAELEALIQAEGADRIAAMIAEPVMGAGGVILPPETYFPKIQAVLARHDILLLADEVICGFGRTGNWFGSQTFGFMPDMMSMAKGLSSGAIPIAAVALSDRIYQAVADQSAEVGVFGHGFTYSGHPVSAAVAAEAIRIYHEIDVVGRARRLGAHLRAALDEALAGHPLVGEIRSVGLLAGIGLTADPATGRDFDPALRVGAQVERRCLAHGAIIRNMGDNIALCPPYVIEPDQIDALVERLRAALDDVADALSRDSLAA
ncbi:aminotransferase [Azospirillum sp. A29]|uniref:aminotransferase n=1 Tax=Azospirillum sp. A29 TaxID=3160606 RepID=UPI00366B72BA